MISSKNKTHFTRFASHIRVVQGKQTTTKNSTVMGSFLWKHWQVGCKINKQNEMRKSTLKWTETLQIVSLLNAIWFSLNVTCHIFLIPKQLNSTAQTLPWYSLALLLSHWLHVHSISVFLSVWQEDELVPCSVAVLTTNSPPLVPLTLLLALQRY